MTEEKLGKYEKTDPNEIVETLNNTESYYGKAVGYCYRHHKYLTCKQYKGRQCLKKCCSHFIKLEKNNFWTMKEKNKKIRDLRKLDFNKRIETLMRYKLIG